MASFSTAGGRTSRSRGVGQLLWLHQQLVFWGHWLWDLMPIPAWPGQVGEGHRRPGAG